MTGRRRAPDPAQLSLFETPAPVARVPTPETVAAPAAATPVLADPATEEMATEDPVAPPPQEPFRPALAAAAPAANLLTPAVFRHPRADREIRLHDHVVAYALKRVRRRSIGFMVGAEGLSVNAPKWIGLGDIESALHEKSTWILKKLGEQRERSERLAAARIEWRDGTTIPFLGEPMRVVIEPRAGTAKKSAARLELADLPVSERPRLTLHIGLPNTGPASLLQDTVQAWLKRQAARVFEERCQIYAQRIGVRYTRLGLSSANTRWGSASADGSIRLNWRLIHLTMPVIDYVVAHELAHLREMNHSPRFWAVVRSVLPDFEAARDLLKLGSVPMFD